MQRFNAIRRGWFLLAVIVTVLTGTAATGQAIGTMTSPSSGPARPTSASPATFTRDMPFGEAIQILRHSTGKPLNIVVLWKEIGDNAGVYPETPIGFDGLSGLTVRQNLEILLGSISATSTNRLGYVVNRGVIVIATLERLPKPRKETRVYDVSDLVAPPSGALGPGMMMGGFGRSMGFGATGSLGRSNLYGTTGGFRGLVGTSQGRGRRR